jgi:hypothetical protein
VRRRHIVYGDEQLRHGTYASRVAEHGEECASPAFD